MLGLATSDLANPRHDRLALCDEEANIVWAPALSGKACGARAPLCPLMLLTCVLEGKGEWC